MFKLNALNMLTMLTKSNSTTMACKE